MKDKRYHPKIIKINIKDNHFQIYLDNDKDNEFSSRWFAKAFEKDDFFYLEKDKR